MKLYFILFLLLAAVCSQAQTTTGRVKWKSASNIIYTYTGELLNGKPHGRGFAVSDSGGFVQVFGEFKNGMIDGSTVVRHSNGRIVVANWKQNKPEGTGVVITPDQDIDYGNFINGIMEGRVISVHWDNKIVIQNKRNGKTNGRAIVIEPDGKTITDRIYVNDTANGPGYQYRVKDKQRFEGIWENDKWVRATTGNYPSFMRNPNFGSVVTEKDILIYSDIAEKDNKKVANDTCFSYDLKNNNRGFGYFGNGEFRNGVSLIGDSIRTIGQFDAKGSNQGFCVLYKKGRYLNIANYKDHKLDGNGISIDIEDSTIYDGYFSADNYTGIAARLMKNKEIRIGNFIKGKLDGEGKIIYPDGRCITGIYKKGERSIVKEIIKTDGIRIDITPKDICTAVNFLLKEWENNFMNIRSGELSETKLLGKYQGLYKISRNSSFIVPDKEGPDGKLHHEFSTCMRSDHDYDLIKNEYNDLCKKLSACTITSLAKGKTLKLIPKINKIPEDGKLERIASFFTIPAYAGKKADPQIRVMVESVYDGYDLTLDIISK